MERAPQRPKRQKQNHDLALACGSTKGRDILLKKYYADREKMMAQARSLHHVVQQSHKSLKQSLADSPATGYVAPLGHFLSLVVLQPLAAETALKATLMMRMGYFVRGHNLSTLFELLDPDMKKGIDEVYQAIVKLTIREQQVVTIAEEPIGDVLERHKNDFERWRYIFELDEASITFIDLHLATRALILNFDVLSIDPSTGDPNTLLLNRARGIMQDGE